MATRSEGEGWQLRIGEWLRAHREAILADWELSSRDAPKARDLDRARLLNHLPLLLDAIASAEDATGPGAEPQVPSEPSVMHALNRLDEGFDLEELANEYRVLRRCILRRLELELPNMRQGELIVLNEALDKAIGESVTSFTRVRDRTIRGLDRISSLAYSAEGLPQLLQRLLALFLESTPAVDSTSILLREGDRLVVRAAAGVGQQGTEGMSIAMGEGIGGQAALLRKPHRTRDASTDPAVVSAELRRSGVHALYAVPLLLGNDLLGIATMGSCTTYELSGEDSLLFRSMAARATGLIKKAQLQQELANREQELRTLAESLPQIVWTALPSGEMDYFNTRATQYTGAPTADFLGAGWASFIHPDDLPNAQASWEEAIRTGEPNQVEHRIRAADGTYRWFLTRAVPVRDAGGRPIRWFGTSTDIDQQKRSQLELQRRAEFGEQLIGIVSHDLRNPISAISLGAHIALNRGVRDAQVRRTLERIVSSAGRAERLIRDLLDFTRARLGGGIELERRPAELWTAVHDAVEETRSAFPDRELLEKPACDTRGDWDLDRMTQVFTNLLRNAVQHGEPDTPVTVSCTASPAEVTVAVHNFGKPIAQALLPRLFEPMVRGAAVGRRIGSVGLGLFIVDQIVRAHAGRVEVRSDAESGTTFTVVLPRSSSPAH